MRLITLAAMAMTATRPGPPDFCAHRRARVTLTGTTPAARPFGAAAWRPVQISFRPQLRVRVPRRPTPLPDFAAASSERRDLLSNANLTVTRYCIGVGFASLGSFSSRFTMLVGEPTHRVPHPLGGPRRSALPDVNLSCAGCWILAAYGARARGPDAQSRRSAGGPGQIRRS